MTLIESLLAIFLLALGILGILGIQLQSMSDAQHSMQRMRAVRLMEDLSEKIRANPAAHSLISTFIAHPNALQARSCHLQKPCSARELAARDMARWHASLRTSLVKGKAILFSAMLEDDRADPHIGVAIIWPHMLKGRSDAWSTFSPSFSAPHAFENCPHGHTCHVQHMALPLEGI